MNYICDNFFLMEHHFKKIKSTLFIEYNFEVVQDKAKFLIIKYLIFDPLLSCAVKNTISNIQIKLFPELKKY